MRKLIAAFWCASVLAASVLAANANLMTNPGFETGNYNSWSRVFGPNGGRFDAVTGATFGVTPYEGIRMAGAAGSYDNSKHQSYIRQVVAVPVGYQVDISGWGYAWNYDAQNRHVIQDTQVRIGWDPTGGLDATAATVIWAPRIFATGQWEERTLSGISQAAQITVFAQVIHRVPWEWNLTYVDNFRVTAFDPTPPAPEPIPEPATLAMVGLGLAGIARLRRRA